MRQYPPSTVTHTRSSWWLRALAVLVAAIGGFVAYRMMAESALVFLTSLLISGLAGAIGAFLWHTWRAVIVIPAVLWLGAVVAAVMYRVGAPDPVLIGAEVEWALDLLVLAALPAMVGAAIGVAIGIGLERRLGR